ncbi:MAG: DUF2752 domain-containing protein [Clostridia bacterium]|nr:DUF2752 domain-containing protein [Clostridia bacterium]
MFQNKCFRVIVGIGFPLCIAAIIYWAVQVKVPLPCFIYTRTGIFCPSCGATRAIISLLCGDFKAALNYNCFIVLTAPLLFGLALYLYAGVVFGHITNLSDKTKIHIAVFITIIALLFLVFGILRNIPLYPFTLLAPI